MPEIEGWKESKPNTEYILKTVIEYTSMVWSIQGEAVGEPAVILLHGYFE